MWTRNYKNLIATEAVVSNSGYNGTAPHGEFGGSYFFNYKQPNGAVREICNLSSYDDVSSAALASVSGSNVGASVNTITDQMATGSGVSSVGSSSCFVGFGSSATEETETDYALGAQITAFTQISTSAKAVLNEDGTFTINYQVVITATSDITIQEIGLFKGVAYYYSSSSAKSYALINRIVLDEPISVASGELANITFSVITPKITFA